VKVALGIDAGDLCRAGSRFICYNSHRFEADELLAFAAA
jgi:hypothetical protein